MKSKIFVAVLALASAQLLNQSAHGAATAGGSAGAGAGAGSAGASVSTGGQGGSTSAGTSGNAAFGTPPASGNSSVSSSTSGNTGVNTPATQPQTPTTPPPNALVPNPPLVPATNGNVFAGQTNAGGTNQNGGNTNQVNVTNQFFNTNQVFVTNQVSSTNVVSVTNLGPNDVAATPFDRALLLQVRQRAYLKDPGISTAWNAVSFASQSGTILVSGSVAQIQDKDKLLVLVRDTPGVVAIVDHVMVSPQAPNQSGGTISGFLSPASDPSLGDSYRYSTTRSNRFGQRVYIPPARGKFIATNMTPTGSTNPAASNAILEGVVGTNVITVPVGTNATNQ